MSLLERWLNWWDWFKATIWIIASTVPAGILIGYNFVWNPLPNFDEFTLGLFLGAMYFALIIYGAGPLVLTAVLYLTYMERPDKSIPIRETVVELRTMTKTWVGAGNKLAELKKKLKKCKTKEEFHDVALEVEKAQLELKQLREQGYSEASRKLDEWFENRGFAWDEDRFNQGSNNKQGGN